MQNLVLMYSLIFTNAVQHFFQLEAGTSTYVHFPFVATVIGDVTVKLSAYSFLDRDEEEFTISVSVS